MNTPEVSRQRGSTIIEFALVIPLLTTLFFGSIGIGIMMGRYVQAVQVCRDIAHMYSNSVDFSQTTNRNIAVQLAQGTGMTAAGGNGVVILSRITTVYQSDCDAAGYSSSCDNLNQAVITQRQTVGLATLRTSAFGTPTSSIMDAQGNIAASVYLRNTDSSVQATGFTALLTAAGTTQPQGKSAWVAEVYFKYPDIGFLGVNTNGGAYVRFIF